MITRSKSGFRQASAAHTRASSIPKSSSPPLGTSHVSPVPPQSSQKVPPPNFPGMPVLLPPPPLSPTDSRTVRSRRRRGEFASRVVQHLQLLSRNRSMSPQSHLSSLFCITRIICCRSYGNSIPPFPYFT